MALSEPQKKYLRGLGHQLNPTILIGDKGITESLLSEFESTLAHHELIKVKIRGADREGRAAAIEQLCESSSAVLVQQVGNVALLYRENPEKQRIRLPRR